MKRNENPLMLIEDWRKTFSMPVRKEPTVPSLSEQNLASKLIQEELDELKEAMKNNDMIEIADACGDLLFVVMQAINIHGLDASKLIEIVYNSNMSKLANTEDEAQDSIINYIRHKGVNAHYEKLGDKFAIKRTVDKKLLKAISFKEPEWEKDYPELKNPNYEAND